MTILDILVLPTRGVVLIFNPSDPDLNKIRPGMQLSQGEKTWKVVGVEASRPATAQACIIVKPADPVPERGEITVVE